MMRVTDYEILFGNTAALGLEFFFTVTVTVTVTGGIHFVVDL